MPDADPSNSFCNLPCVRHVYGVPWSASVFTSARRQNSGPASRVLLCFKTSRHKICNFLVFATRRSAAGRHWNSQSPTEGAKSQTANAGTDIVGTYFGAE